MKKGIFVAFEGLDGSGKTTQFNAIKAKLSQMGVNCMGEKQPSDSTLIGLIIRGILKKLDGLSVSPVSLAKLYSVDRYEHIVNVVKPHIDKGSHVLMDRYIFSSFAFQGLTSSFDDIYLYNQDAINLLMPDITVFIDTSPEICLERINTNRVGNELFDFEGIAIRERFFDAFERMKDSNILIVDGNRPADDVTNEILGKLKPLFDL